MGIAIDDQRRVMKLCSQFQKKIELIYVSIYYIKEAYKVSKIDKVHLQSPVYKFFTVLLRVLKFQVSSKQTFNFNSDYGSTDSELHAL